MDDSQQSEGKKSGFHNDESEEKIVSIYPFYVIDPIGNLIPFTWICTVLNYVMISPLSGVELLWVLSLQPTYPG